MKLNDDDKFNCALSIFYAFAYNGQDPFYEATQGLFEDGPQNFEPQSDDKDDTRTGTPALLHPATRFYTRLGSPGQSGPAPHQQGDV
ncbi:hypothetical protein AVEN_62243-1 [Araneus ventricosus]|uniref:Uncharacterized protein n=1 Tax=Araneus ventricosus TaxID=182803 RepID=A0A4Y2ECB0_ARAVE|nr:hypothetical protein AVEN_62243-1 [Araneus ventricosus]